MVANSHFAFFFCLHTESWTGYDLISLHTPTSSVSTWGVELWCFIRRMGRALMVGIHMLL